MIPLVDLKTQHLSLKNEIDGAISKVIENTAFIMGENVEGFEKEFADFCNAKYAVATASGTAALQLLMHTYGIKPGDEIITVPNTFIATTEMITQIGAKIKFVDVEPDTMLMDVSKLKEAITDKTKAILPVHLYGHMVDMKPLMEIAEEKNLFVIEDSCQAHGAEYNGKRTPITSAAFSFFPAKNLGAYGDAGCVVTNDEEMAEKAAMFRDHGRKKGEKYIHTFEGTGQRMDAMQAAILRAKLKHLEEWNDSRRRNAKLYNELLTGVSKPVERDYAKHVYYMYVIRSQKRDELQKYLKENDIQTGIHYPVPLHMQPAYNYLGIKEGTFPEAERAVKEILSIPMYPELTEEHVRIVADKINEIK